MTFHAPRETEHPDETAWMREAACAGEATSLFFPGDGTPGTTSETMADTAAAKAICASCPVREPCLAYALKYRLNFGIWGGKADVERKRIRRRKGAA